MLRARCFFPSYDETPLWTANCVLAKPDDPPVQIESVFLTGDAETGLYQIGADGALIFLDPRGVAIKDVDEGSFVSRISRGVEARRLRLTGFARGRRDTVVHVHTGVLP